MGQSKRIAIIGGGVSGVSVLNHLIHHELYDPAFEIDIYDSREGMANGKAFRYDNSQLLMNVPSHLISLSDNLNEFKEWMEREGYPDDQYPPRAVFGEYIKDFLKTLSERDNVNVLYQFISDILPEDGRYKLYTDDDEKMYDAVLLCTGQMDYSDPYGLKGTDKYIHDPYPMQDKLTGLNGRIGLIGSGLTSIDCFRYLFMEENHNHIHAFSRSGEMPSVRGTETEVTLRYFTTDGIEQLKSGGLMPLNQLIQLFKKEMEYQGIDQTLFYRKTQDPYKDIKYDLKHKDAVGRLQYLIIEAHPVISAAYQYLSRKDKEVFMGQYHALLDGNHSPMPPQTAEQILKWVDEGRLHLYSDMTNVEVNNGFRLDAEDDSIQVDILINATGPVQNIDKDDSALIKSLKNRYIIGPAEFGGITVDEERRIISPRYGTMNGFYVLGALSVNVDYLANGVDILGVNAKILADTFYKDMHK